MWERGEEDAVAISSYLDEEGLKGCRVLDAPCGIGRVANTPRQAGIRGHGSRPLAAPGRRGQQEGGATSSWTPEGRGSLVGDMRELGSKFAPGSFDAVLNVFTSIGYGPEEDDLRFFREAREVTRRGGLLLISGLRNRDYIARNPSQNVYEESRKLLVLDTYSFDSARSRERGVWRFYLKQRREGGSAQVRRRVPCRHKGLLAARARPAAGGDGMERESRPTSRSSRGAPTGRTAPSTR